MRGFSEYHGRSPHIPHIPEYGEQISRTRMIISSAYGVYLLGLFTYLVEVSNDM